jgi:ubiquinone/menaquinone biosynthesis C-methylase UbiE
MKWNYDTIAWFYDRLAQLFFGKALVNAQRCLLHAIPAGARVLIVGGGTGRILEEIAKVHPSGLSITYVDASEKMVSLARKRNMAGNNVVFIAAPVETAALQQYDVALTPFFLDNFNDYNMRKIISLIDRRLSPHAAWLYCDFRDNGVFWQKAVLKLMYAFFSTTCHIEASRLPDAAGCFTSLGYKVASQRTFINGFVIAEVMSKGLPKERGAT